LRAYFDRNIKQITASAEKQMSADRNRVDLANRLTEFAQSLASIVPLLDTPAALDLEDLERRLTVLDEKIQASLTQYATEDQMLRIRREVDSQLTQYRRKMKAEQIALVERQYIQKRLLEEFGLPRLSLYYFS
jgi:DNA repair exonuclease SbcCD ATPase subunit